jgi:hypothetical protein
LLLQHTQENFLEIAFDSVLLAAYNARFSLGGVPERSKGSDCKSDGTAFEGSNPSPSTNGFMLLLHVCVVGEVVIVSRAL